MVVICNDKVFEQQAENMKDQGLYFITVFFHNFCDMVEQNTKVYQSNHPHISHILQ